MILPTLLSPERQVQLDREVGAIRNRIFDQIKALLLRIPDPELQKLAYDTAFRANQRTPKRQERLGLAICVLTDTVYSAHDRDPVRRDLLMQLALAMQEYYDLLDDWIDCDLAPGHETEVVLVTQLLMPVMVQVLAELGSRAADYWSRRALDLAGSVAQEKLREKSLTAYLDALSAQAWYYGCATGLAALVGGADAPGVALGESVGRHAYIYGQLLLDLHQRDRLENWNILHFVGRDQAIDRIATERDELVCAARRLPPPQAALLEGFHSLDLDSLRTGHLCG
jgi:hypothetical protein